MTRQRPILPFHLLLLLAVCAMATAVTVQAAKFEDGVHYHALFEPQPIATGSRIEVLEIFWYHCPHCYAMQPLMEKWAAEKKPANVELRRLPGVFRRATEFDAQVFFSLQRLGLVDSLHAAIYESIHFGKNRFKSLSDVQRVLDANGVDRAAFEQAFESDQVKDMVRLAEQQYEKYEATGVPTVIVDGRWRTSANSAGGYQELVEVIEFLVELAASGRA